jgi:hypothetical protein
MASVPDSVERMNSRARKDSVAESLDAEKTGKRRRPRRTSPVAVKADRIPPATPAAAPAPAGPSVCPDDQLDLLWGQLQSQMLELLTHGIAAPFQQRAFDKLDYSMKQCAKFQRERAEDLRHARPREPDPEELAAILDKIDRRIDALAEDRFKNLVDGKLHRAGKNSSSAGMDD